MANELSRIRSSKAFLSLNRPAQHFLCKLSAWFNKWKATEDSYFHEDLEKLGLQRRKVFKLLNQSRPQIIAAANKSYSC